MNGLTEGNGQNQTVEGAATTDAQLDGMDRQAVEVNAARPLRGETVDIDFDDFEMPRAELFGDNKNPAFTVNVKVVGANSVCVRQLWDVDYVEFAISHKRQLLLLVPCSEYVVQGYRWAREKDGKRYATTRTGEPFVLSICQMMGWDPKCRYKVLGEVRNSDRGLILVFDMTECICYEKGKEAYTNPATGEVKQRQIKRYLDESNNHIGKPYNDYEAERKLNQFENTGGYSDGSEDSSNDAAADTGGRYYF